MPYRLLKFAWNREHPEPRMFRSPAELNAEYDAVIIGAGGHGLAAAYYLAQDHGITNVAVLDKGYIGGGGTGRNTAIVRSNYLTREGAALERELSDAQRERMRAAYRTAGPVAVAGFRQVLEAMMDDDSRRQYEALAGRGG